MTDDKSTGTEPQSPRKKGGADGKAKSPEAKERPEPTGAAAPAEPAETGPKSRKITTTRR